MIRISRIIILIAFIVALLVIVYILFNTNKIIKQLIDGNQDLIETLYIKNDLEKLHTNVVTLENRVRAAIIKGEVIDTNYLNTELGQINVILTELDTLSQGTLSTDLFNDLKRLLINKTRFNTLLFEAYRTKGKVAAEHLARKGIANFSTDSIKILADKINSIHENSITSLINTADKNTYTAKKFSTILAVLATLVCFLTFGYISFKLREQYRLIVRLNESEKQVKEIIKVKENFLANMSHEIRTPLNAILGFTDLLQKQQLRGEALEYLGFIKKSGSGLLTIVNEILDLSKIEAGMMRIEKKSFSIHDTLDFMDTMFQSKFAEKELTWRIMRGARVPNFVVGDMIRLNQVLINIISNALKFTESGGVKLSVGKVESEDRIKQGEDIYIKFEIEDTGIGIEKESLESIFDRFQQVDSEPTRKYGGTGLGLSIVKKLVELQNGSIEVRNIEPSGTLVTVILPFGVHDQGSQPEFYKSDILPLTPDRVQLDGIVLIAEDNSINQAFLYHLLGTWQISAVMVSDGQEAIHYLTDHTVDLVLMDIQMPVLDGYSATNYIRLQLKNQVPIIAMTAHAFESEKQKCYEAGMTDYISKPLDIDRLFDLIQKYLPKTVKKSAHIIDEKKIFKWLDMQYLDELSAGDHQFKKSLLSQCIDILPTELENLEKAVARQDLSLASSIAHDLKSNVAVIGLNSTLAPFLDRIEEGQSVDEIYLHALNTAKSIILEGLLEADLLMASLD